MWSFVNVDMSKNAEAYCKFVQVFKEYETQLLLNEYASMKRYLKKKKKKETARERELKKPSERSYTKLSKSPTIKPKKKM